MRLNTLSTPAYRGLYAAFGAALCASFSMGLSAPALAKCVSTPAVPPYTPLPSEASAAVPAITHRSAFADYQPWRTQTLAPWATPTSAAQPNATAPLKVIKPHDHGAAGH